MPIGAVIGAVGAAATVGSAVIGSNAADRAADKQSEAADRASATQLEMFNQTRKSLQPFINTGTGAFSTLAQLYGLPTAKYSSAPDSAGSPGTWETVAGTGKPDFSAFTASPDYAFARDEGMNALERTAAARGGLISGNQLRAAQQFGQGLASQQFGNYFNRMMGIAQVGQNAAAGVGNAATATGQGVANSQIAGGQAQASGIVGGANAVTGALGSGMNNLAYWNAMNNMSSFGPNTSAHNLGHTMFGG